MCQKRPDLIREGEWLHDDPTTVIFDRLAMVPAKSDLVQVALEVFFAQAVENIEFCPLYDGVSLPLDPCPFILAP
jgi:hypothetical protein